MGTYVLYTSKILVAKKGLDFFPEIARSGRHKLIQYNRVGSSGLNCRETTKKVFPIDFSWGIFRCMYSYLVSRTTNLAAVADAEFFPQLERG